MKIIELKNFIESRVAGTYFPNQFPISQAAPDDCSVVKLTGGFPPSQWTGKKQPSFQVRVRGTDDAETESRAYEIHGALLNLRDIKIGKHSIVVIRSNNSVPLYLGEDSSNRILYSMNFDMVIRPV